MEIDERMNAICINMMSMFDITIQYLDEAIDVYLNSSVMMWWMRFICNH